MHAATARCILQAPNRNELLRDVAHLYPVQLTDIPDEMLQLCRQAHVSTLETLVAVESARDEADKLDSEALLRLVLAMQMNIFYSGVYIRMALINHGCNPNCHKFFPKGTQCASAFVS